jgi:2-polyprenyl-3-methyl-5-hydroxy-6-metoxy-1,4-benzoquinol methylase
MASTTLFEALPRSAEHASELASGDRFEFGENWRRFLGDLTEERIGVAERSLTAMLGANDLRGKTFLDAGCGSGLFSLAAKRLGASVRSFDYDPKSAACALELKRRYFSGDPHWRIEEGSVLDAEYLERLGQFDVVYSWGVLHHTGAMRQALENIAKLVARRGKLFISIYNDQGSVSKRWLAVKRLYNRTPEPLRFAILMPALAHTWWRPLVKDVLRGRPFASWRAYQKNRGMHPWCDVVDWVGGYPFEVAKPEQIFEFFQTRGFVLEKLATAGGSLGCNEFVFRRSALQSGVLVNSRSA